MMRADDSLLKAKGASKHITVNKHSQPRPTAGLTHTHYKQKKHTDVEDLNIHTTLYCKQCRRPDDSTASW